MPLRNDVLQPVAGANPAGASLRYDPVYDKIKEARRADDDAPQGDWARARKVADWPQVIKLAGDALATKSKDLQLAAWLTEALLRHEGLAGLQAGLGLLADLQRQFWDNLYPEIEDGDLGLRAAPLEWVARALVTPVKQAPLTKAGHDFFQYKESRALGYEADAGGDEKKLASRAEAVADGKLTPEEFDKGLAATPKAWYKELVAQIETCTTAVRTLETLTDEKLGDEGPAFANLIQALDDVGGVARQLLAKKLETDPDPLPAGGEMGVGTGAASGAAAASGGALSPEPVSVDDAAQRIVGAARYLRRANPRSPAPYLMLRGFRWGELGSGADLDPKLLAAPPTSLRTHLKGLLLDGRWPELLDAAEDVLATPHGRGWLDLQRYELTAAEQLGAEFEAVSLALRVALVGLLRDLPQLPDLTLMDDTPTANAETRQWLQSTGIVAAAAEAAAEGGSRPAAPELRPRTGGWAYERAMDEVRAGRPQKGVELLLRQADQEKSSRGGFVARAQAAGIMVEAGLEAVAMPILKELLDQIEAHKLEEWEAGDLVARPLGLLYRCLQKLGGDAELQDSLYRRICRLDPLQAMTFSGAPGGSDGTSGA